MFRSSISYRSIAGCVAAVVDSPKEFVRVVDQFDAQDFNENEAGWIRNDISQLARATSQSQYDAIMRRLVELKQEGGIKEGTTVDEAISQIKPRYAQSPNEIEHFIALTNGNVMDKVNAAYQEALKDVKVEKDAPAPSPDGDKSQVL